jgi:beta-lactamase class A
MGNSLISMDNSLKSLPAPILQVSPPSSKNTKDMVNLKAEIGSYLKNYKGEYGVYYYNLTTGDEFGINDEDVFTGASTEKIPINLYLYSRISAGAADPNGTLTYLKEDYEDGTGDIRYQKVGTKYTLKRLSVLSIEVSDNVAANMLVRFLGIQNIKDYMRQVGGTVVVDGQNTSSPKDMGLYMKLVYQFYKNNGALGNELMNSFLNTQYNDRINALLPASVKVAHKIGNDVEVVNDVGIVFGDQPYVISIMSKGVDENEAPGVIANISKMIYDTVSREK